MATELFNQGWNCAAQHEYSAGRALGHLRGEVDFVCGYEAFWLNRKLELEEAELSAISDYDLAHS